jgi:DNA polymerase I
VELKFDPDNPTYEFIQTPDALDKALEALEKESVIGVDVEGTGLDPYTSTLLLVQIGTEETSYIFDARELDLSKFPRYKSLIEDPKRIKLLHNAKFDYKFLKVQTKAALSNVYDTMLAGAVLTAGLVGKNPSLKELTHQYCGIDLEKGIRKTFANHMGPITEAQLKYSGLDTLVMFPIFKAQLQELRKENLVKVAKLEFASTIVVAEMELRGICIDVERWREVIEQLEDKRSRYAEQFQEMIRPYYNTRSEDLFGNSVDAMNVNSQAQLMDLLNNRIGLDLPNTSDGLLKITNHPVVNLLRDYRKYEKLISAFGETLLEKVNPVTGRLHPDFNQMGTATGRFSCKDPNLQQIPRNSEEAPFRELFMPAPGYKLVTADYSSFEMRILADLSGDEKMIKALREGLDIHSYTASLMFNVPYTENFKKEHPDLRQIAKPIGFGLMYGMSSMGLAAQLEVSRDKGEEYMELYFKSYPSVREFLDGLSDSAVKKGWSTTPLGRKRWYNRPSPTDDDYRRKMSSIRRQAKNHPIQGTNADAIKFAFVFIKKRFEETGVDGGITHTVHDEIVCEVREDQAEDWAKIQSDEMVRAAELFITKVPVRSDPFVGDIWEH